MITTTVQCLCLDLQHESYANVHDAKEWIRDEHVNPSFVQLSLRSPASSFDAELVLSLHGIAHHPAPLHLDAHSARISHESGHGCA